MAAPTRSDGAAAGAGLAVALLGAGVVGTVMLLGSGAVTGATGGATTGGGGVRCGGGVGGAGGCGGGGVSSRSNMATTLFCCATCTT